MPSTNEILLDKGIEHSFYMERLKAHEARVLLDTLYNTVWQPLHSEVVERIANIRARSAYINWKYNQRLQYLDKSMGKIISEGYKQLGVNNAQVVREVAKMEVSWQVASMQEALPIRVGLAQPDLRMLGAMIVESPFEGAVLSDWWERAGFSVRTAARESILTGLARGESTDQIASRFRHATEGLSRRQAESIVRTSITHASARAREETYQQNDVIKAVQYVATLDARTTLECASLDGQEFPVNEGPRPPMHYRCRSTTVPVLKSYKEYGLKDPAPSTRASMDGSVPGKTTYSEWLKRQSVDVQNEVLGVRRGRMFRQGRSLTDMVDRRNEPLTLAELERRGK